MIFYDWGSWTCWLFYVFWAESDKSDGVLCGPCGGWP